MIVAAELVFPRDQGRIEIKMEIVRVEDKGVARGQFIGLTETEEDRLHSYVLNHQKETVNR